MLSIEKKTALLTDNSGTISRNQGQFIDIHHRFLFMIDYGDTVKCNKHHFFAERLNLSGTFRNCCLFFTTGNI